MLPIGIKQVVLVASTEGGTGCGATPIIAKYFGLMNLPVHIFAFIGFQDEARGINNTLRFFKELGDNVILHTIQNDCFKDYTGSYSKAEDAANKEFCKQFRILLGYDMVNSHQNIDDTDHYKIATTPGYMDIKHIQLSGAKNVETTNKMIVDAFENGCNLDYYH
jgi:cell division GTPase FtsZ